jgi:hypothetical protein
MSILPHGQHDAVTAGREAAELQTEVTSRGIAFTPYFFKIFHQV